MPNHWTQPSGLSMYCSAIRFCGDAIGDVCPPIFDASAMPITILVAYGDLGGRLRKIGCTSENMSTGAATFEIHILAKHATSICASSTTLGRLPAYCSTRVAKTLSMPYLDSAAASVKPPRSSEMFGANICEKIHLLVSGAERRRPSPSPSRATRSVTIKKGTSNDVTNSSTTSVTHKLVHSTSRAKQFCTSTRSNMRSTGALSSSTNTRRDNANCSVPTVKNDGTTNVPNGVRSSRGISGSSPSVPPVRPIRLFSSVAACARRSILIISRHTVLRCHTTSSRSCIRSCCCASSSSPRAATRAYIWTTSFTLSIRRACAWGWNGYLTLTTCSM